MKTRNIVNAFVLALSLASITACTQETAKEETTETRKMTDKAYVCPMHCEGSAGNQPGKCPVCDMDLEKNPDYVAPASASNDTAQTGTTADTAATK